MIRLIVMIMVSLGIEGLQEQSGTHDSNHGGLNGEFEDHAGD